MNNFNDGIMRKDEKNAKLTELEINRNKKISKVRYIIEQYFGLSHLHDKGQRARFITIVKNNIDIWLRQVANIQRGFKILKNRLQRHKCVQLIKINEKDGNQTFRSQKQVKLDIFWLNPRDF